MKLCVFPNDPLVEYYKKGEIKERYFNPKNIFDEIHVISFIDKDLTEEVSMMFGNAKYFIHSVGSVNLTTYTKKLHRIITLVKEINPDIIRAYNPLIQGWFAAKCSEKLKIPLILSLHTQYDQNRKIAKKENLKKYFRLKITQKMIEPYVLDKADKVIIVYNIIRKYVKKYKNDNVELIYNKIDCNRFANGKIIKSLPQPLILSVGNLIKEKNFECIIKSMKFINAYCLIIGKGNDFSRLQKIVKENNLQEKILFKESVPHNEIQDYYKTAKVFALAYDPELEGLPMPVMESMAAGTQIVIPFQKKEYGDNLEDLVNFADRNEEDFAEKIIQILQNQHVQENISSKLKFEAKRFDISTVEQKEAKVYLDLVGISKD